MGAGGLANNGATQLNSTLGVTGLVSIQGLTTNSTVTMNSVGRLVLNGATQFLSGTTISTKSLGITLDGVNYWLQLYT